MSFRSPVLLLLATLILVMLTQVVHERATLIVARIFRSNRSQEQQ